MTDATMTEVKILATGFGFPEGPVVCKDGSVVLTEIRNNQLSRVDPGGDTSVFSRCGGGPNGLAFGPDGALYLCNNGGSRYVEGHSMGIAPHPDYKFGYIQRIDPNTGEARTLLHRGRRPRCPRRMIWCSMSTADSISPIWASASPGIATTEGFTMPCPTARRSQKLPIPCSVRTAAGCRRTARRFTPRTRKGHGSGRSISRHLVCCANRHRTCLTAVE